MRILLYPGRLFFALGLIGFGIQQLIFGEFVAGRPPPWPEQFPGRTAWAWLTGAVFIATGASIIAGKRVRLSALFAGVLIAVWALFRNIPAAVAASAFSGEWTVLGKSLVFSGGLLAIASTFPRDDTPCLRPFSPLLNVGDGFTILGRWCLGVFMALCGIQHFIHVEFVAGLIPPWIPGATIWTWITGVALIAGGIGIVVPQTFRLAAFLSGVMIFAWVFLIHIPLALAAGPSERVPNGWTATLEALAVSGLAWVLAAGRFAPIRSSGPLLKTKNTRPQADPARARF